MAVTHRRDIAADMVVLAAERRGVELFRLNTEDYPVRLGLDVDPLRVVAARLIGGGLDVPIGRARGIWLRRPRWPEITPEVSDPLDRLFARQEAVAAIGGLWRLLADRCVSAADALQAARWKVAQLSVARAVGFLVPASLVTTDEDAARSFVAARPTVLKAVGQAAVALGDEDRVGHTVELDSSFEAAAVRPTPVLLQERIAKRADLRVTVVGPRVFAVRVRTPPDAPLDFRITHPDNCTYEVVDVEPVFENRLHAYLAHWPLRYGAFDFAEAADGSSWFLECNPGGQWGWIERATGVGITDALIDLLLDPIAVRA